MIPLWVYTLPYVEGGRDKGGVDCWGLVVVLYQYFYGIEVADYKEITLPSLDCCHETSRKLNRQLREQTEFYEVEHPKFGDVVLINVLGEPLHIGFCLDDSSMIHTGRSHGVVVENFTEAKWNRKIAGFYRNESV